jgi:hypothetical protein
MKTINDKVNLNIIANDINKNKKKNTLGSVVYNPFFENEYVVVLGNIIKLNEKISDNEKNRIIRNSIKATDKAGNITSKSIISSIFRLEKEYLKLPEKTYKVLTSISILGLRKKFIFNNSTIVIWPKLNDVFKSNYYDQAKQAKMQLFDDLPKFYNLVSISLKARTPTEAIERGLDNINFIRGVLNININSKTSRRSSGGRRKPINKIIIGPVHTCHLQNGDLALNNYYFETDYNGQVTSIQNSLELKSAFDYMSEFRNLFNKSHYKKDIKKAIIRYCQALDTTNWNASFISLWGILESLTGFSSVSNYDKCIKRVSNLFKNERYHYSILQSLREYRNNTVHDSVVSNNIETCLYQLKYYVEFLIQFHVNNVFNFQSLEAFYEFADSINDLQTINYKLKMYNNIKRFIT